MVLNNEEEIMEKLEEKGIDKGKVKDALESKKKEAEDILYNEEETHKLLNRALKLCDKLSRLPIIGSVFETVPWTCMLISDYVKGNYKEVPLATIISLTAAVVYFVSPIDVIPDVIPFVGQLDDAAVMLFALHAAKNDLEAYEAWRIEQMDYE